MRFAILLFSLLSLQNFAFADGRSVATEVCRSAMDPQNCLNTVRMSSYIDEGAARACAYNRVHRTACIQAISNKIYSFDEVHYCASPELNDQKRIRCFQRYGRPYMAPPPPPTRPEPYPQPLPPPPPGPILVPTAEWIALGVVQAPKAVSEVFHFSINQSFATEIRVSAGKNEVVIRSAIAIDQFGREFVVQGLLGTIHENSVRVARLNHAGVLALQALRLEVSTPSLLGSRGELTVHVGIAR